jgi:hypothetical protein
MTIWTFLPAWLKQWFAKQIAKSEVLGCRISITLLHMINLCTASKFRALELIDWYLSILWPAANAVTGMLAAISFIAMVFSELTTSLVLKRLANLAFP